VVDFIDVGVGDARFWTFNVADSAVSVGAVLLVLLLWRYEGRVHAAQQAEAATAAAPGAGPNAPPNAAADEAARA
jgi:signal peptidase II